MIASIVSGAAAVGILAAAESAVPHEDAESFVIG
jgi:hypothetical protein